jgi:hypothetical protein
MDGIIYQGKVIKPTFAIEVVDARQKYSPKFWWDPKDDPRNCRPRLQPILGGVIHHQAGEGDADNVFNNLNARPKKGGGFTYLSVHFEIDQKGIITQLADLETVCQHAGDANEWSWGVEIANLGRGNSSPNWPRASYWDEMHGVKTQYLAFYDVQLEACLKLVRAVHQITVLGTDIAVDSSGKVIRRVLTDKEREGNEIFAHFHLTDNKPDPSPHLMDYLAKNLP